MSTPSVSQFGGNTTSVSDGTSVFVWNDKNNNGKVDKGDLVVATSQTDMSVMSLEIGQKEGTYAFGDPHLDNISFTDKGSSALTGALDKVFQDAKDGKLDNAASLTEARTSIAQNGTRENILDFHSSMTMKMVDGTQIDYGVVKQGKIGYTDSVDLTVTDSNGATKTLTIGEVWAGNGGAGQSGVTEKATAGFRLDRNAKDSPVFYEAKGANVMHSVRMYGADAGTAKYAHVLNSEGQVNESMGKMNIGTIKFYDSVICGDRSTMKEFAMTLAEPMNEQERNAEARAAERAAAGRRAR